MEIVRKKIKYVDLVSTDYLYFKVNLTQTFDNMGEFSEMPFIPAPVLNRPLTIPEKFLRLGGAVAAHWYVESGMLSGTTDSKVLAVRGYDATNPYVPHYDVEEEFYYNFAGVSIDGVDRVTNIADSVITFVTDANKDATIGTINQTSGLQFKEPFPNPNNSSTVRYYGEGWNETNSSLSALYKEEYLMGINFIPEIENDIFIDRGNISVIDYHLRMSEIETLNHLESYGNGFFNIKRD